jgi:glypican 4
VGCGQPKLGRQRRSYPVLNSNADLFIDDEQDDVSVERTKRAADPVNQENRRNNQEIKVEPFKFPRNENFQGNRGNTNRGRSSNRNSQRYTNGGNKSDNTRESSLDKLVKEIRQKVKDTKKFWSNLPYTACNSDEFPTAGNSDSCWNGQTINRSVKKTILLMKFAIQTVNFIARYIQSTKPADVPSNANARQNQVVAQQVHILKTTINHLKNAYNGNDIEWSDTGKLLLFFNSISMFS